MMQPTVNEEGTMEFHSLNDFSRVFINEVEEDLEEEDNEEEEKVMSKPVSLDSPLHNSSSLRRENNMP